MAKTIRDMQAKRLYSSEEKGAWPWNIKLQTLEDCDLLIQKIWNNKPLKRRYKMGSPPRVVQGRSNAPAWGGSRQISLPQWAWRKIIVYHEAAHAIVDRNFLSVQGHGWEFARVFLDIVHFMEGIEPAKNLRAAFKAGGVKYYPPKERQPLTPERREALKAQILAVRPKALEMIRLKAARRKAS